MNENEMSQLDAELEHAGEETALSPQMLLLEKLRITPEKELPKMDFLFRLFDKPCFPRRELVAITGKAKSGKTFVTSMLMAVGSQEGSINQLPLKRIREEQLHVLWYDTEQSDESTQDILKNRIMKLAADKRGLAQADLFDAENNSWSGKMFDVFNVRGVAWKERRSLLCEAVTRCKPDLPKLIGDVMVGREQITGSELKEQVCNRANIGSWKFYNKLLEQAVNERIIMKTFDKVGHVIYTPAPF